MTFNIISAGDPVLASPVMQNFRHINYGSALLPVNSSGVGVNNTLDLGSSAYKWKDAYFSGGINVGATGAGPGAIKGPRIIISSDQIERWDANSNAEMYINYNGYNGGTTQYRDFGVYDGKNNNILFVDGSAGNVGIGTTAPGKALEINSSTGACLRLTYNDSDGSATNYCDFAVSSGGDLTITPSGGDVTIAGIISNSNPACRVYNSSAFTATNAAQTYDLTWSSENYDTDTMHSTSVNTERITINNAGTYQINASIDMSKAANTLTYVRILRYNSSDVLQEVITASRQYALSSQEIYHTMAGIAVCSATDYIKVTVYSDQATTNFTTGTDSHLSVIKIK